MDARQHSSSTRAFDPATYAEKIRADGYYRCRLEPGGLDLQRLVSGLGTLHRHNLGDSYVWDVRPTGADPSEAARSHSFLDFPLHTDCSYENPSPDRVVLYVVHADRFGGGVSELRDGMHAAAKLPESERAELRRDFPFRVPREFDKGHGITWAPILFDEGIRFRRDIIVDALIDDRQRSAIARFTDEVARVPLASFALADHEALFLDNARMLHGRTAIKDPDRLLRRIRYFSAP